MDNGNRKMILFDTIYSILIAVLLVELYMSGSVYVNSDAAVIVLSVAAAMLVVLVILKEQNYFKDKIRHPRFFGKM